MITYGEWMKEQRFYERARTSPLETLESASVHVFLDWCEGFISDDTLAFCVETFQTLEAEVA